MARLHAEPWTPGAVAALGGREADTAHAVHVAEVARTLGVNTAALARVTPPPASRAGVRSTLLRIVEGHRAALAEAEAELAEFDAACCATFRVSP